MIKAINGSISLYGTQETGFATISTVGGTSGIISDGFGKNDRPSIGSATEAVWRAARLLRERGVNASIQIVEDRQVAYGLKVPHIAEVHSTRVPNYGGLQFRSTGVAA